MATNYQLKPFTFNLTDLNFIKDQINFRPLFDAAGNAIIAWDGTGAIYDAKGTQYDTTGMTAAQAMAAFGTSYASVTASQGLRDVSGVNNNLFFTNKFWGSVDQPFLQTVEQNFDSYIKPNATGFYGSKSFTTSTAGNTDYTKRGDNPNTPADETATDRSVVDYTPRMISRTITTGGSTPLQDPSVDGGQVLHWNAARYLTDSAYAAAVDTVSIGGVGLIEGAAIIKDYGILAGGQHDPQDPTNNEMFFGAINPGVAPGNSFLAYFGQFFDHGLDFVGKGASGTKITIPLATDDPLYRAPGTNGPNDPGNTKITVSRADVSGFDANGNPQWINHTSPFIDQSQTYGSHEQMTSLLREWVSTDGGINYHAGAHMLDGNTSVAWTNAWGETTNATLPTLNELRAHLIATGRDDLSWADVLNLRNRDANGDVATGAAAGSTGQALLLDMNPHFDTAHFTAATVNALTALGIVADINGNYALGGPGSLGEIINFATFEPMTSNSSGPVSPATQALAFEVLLESVGDHYIAGDGRVNENIGLTTIHHVLHEEHNFQVRNIQEAILAQDLRASHLGDNSHAIAHSWQIATATQDANGNYTYGVGGPIAWNESKLFDAAKLTVEMEYQHAAVDQYARTITPDIPEFVGYNSGENATVSVEYAQAAFRFGHSTMRETIDYMDPNGSITGKVMAVALEQAFLNPKLFANTGAAAIAMGMTHQQMNEIDELLTPAMNQGLLGMPLDLATINIARGRDLGIPTLNDFREAVGLTRYISWADFGAHMVHPESLVNFIAAYSFDGDVAKAKAIVGLEDGSITEGSPEAMGYTVDQAIAFLNGDLSVAGADGFNHIDTWIGGLAEVHIMGGLLGETFNLVFVDQIQRLMDGDRFYYLFRLNNLNMGDEIANAQLKDIVERNTGLEHLNGSIFAYADQYIDLSRKVDLTHTTGSYKTDHAYGDILTTNPTLGVYTTSGTNTNSNGSIVTINGVQYIRDIRAAGANGNANVNGENLDGTPDTGANSNEVLVGTDNKDLIYMWAGDDTAYGEGGNDTIYGDAGIDRLFGGDGNDIIYGGDGGDLIDGGAGDDILYGESSGTAAAGLDQVIGGAGNDIIYGGIGIDKLSGGAGDDIIFGESDTDAFTHGGDGNDYIDGGTGGDLLWGDDGDDLIVGKNDQDIVAGLNGDDILRPGNPSLAMGGGPDEVMGGAADGLSDLGNGGQGVGFDMIDFSDYTAAPVGVKIDFNTQQNPAIAIDGTTPFPAWVGIEGAIGSRNDDTVLANTQNNWLFGGSGNDTITGAAGNDVIIGDGIRLDSLIGTYAGSYTHEFDGANNRAIGYSAPNVFDVAAGNKIQDNGLLGNAAIGTADFEKHYTQMLQSKMFKDMVLGGSAVTTLGGIAGTSIGDGGVAGSDTAVFTGNHREYTVEKITFNTQNEGTITAYKVIDTVAGRDGTDIVIGVENLKFASGTFTPDSLLNDAPTITSGGGGASATFNKAENSNTTITTITATDPDNAPGNPLNPQTLTYSIVGGADAALFSINASTGALKFTSGRNFEVPTDAGGNNIYDVIVQVSDGSLTDTQAIAVTVTNVNEAPVITSNGGGASATISVNENTTAVTTVVANDVDAGNVITYAISTTANTTTNADRAKFTINATTGALSFITAPDFEAPTDTANGGSNSYFVTVVARDPSGLTDTQNIRVNVQNVVEVAPNVAPIITSNGGGNNAAVAINENTTAVTTVTASDTNLGDVLTYSLVGGADQARFTINANTGVLSFVNAPDFEAPTDAGTNNIYDVVVQVSDGSLVDTQAIAVTVNDVVEGGAGLTITGTNNADTLNGTNGNDTIYGLSGVDTIFGGDGNDVIVGNTGADILTGGAGNDTFLYATGSDSFFSIFRDTITDFVSGSDKIDFSAIDAIGGIATPGNQAFAFNTTAGAAITAAGQLVYHYETIGATEYTVIQGNTNTNLAPDFEIALVGHINLQASDIVV